jgi:hypothetical protein
MLPESNEWFRDVKQVALVQKSEPELQITYGTVIATEPLILIPPSEHNGNRLTYKIAILGQTFEYHQLAWI